jgi:hypothetical protein
VSWLLGAADSAADLTRPLQPVVQSGRPLVFEWAGTGSAKPVVLTWSGQDRQWGDTLHFDGNGRAVVWLAPGQYRYRTEAGSSGTVAVEDYSDELLPRPVTLQAHDSRSSSSTGRSVARDWLWLFGICVLALSGEWFARRRLGLR